MEILSNNSLSHAILIDNIKNVIDYLKGNSNIFHAFHQSVYCLFTNPHYYPLHPHKHFQKSSSFQCSKLEILLNRWEIGSFLTLMIFYVKSLSDVSLNHSCHKNFIYFASRLQISKGLYKLICWLKINEISSIDAGVLSVYEVSTLLPSSLNTIILDVVDYQTSTMEKLNHSSNFYYFLSRLAAEQVLKQQCQVKFILPAITRTFLPPASQRYKNGQRISISSILNSYSIRFLFCRYTPNLFFRIFSIVISLVQVSVLLMVNNYSQVLIFNFQNQNPFISDCLIFAFQIYLAYVEYLLQIQSLTVGEIGNKNIIKVKQFNLIETSMNQKASNTLKPNEGPPSRQAFAGLSSLLRNAVGNKFMTFFEEVIHSKPVLQQNEEQIALSYKKINKIIDDIQDHITQRLQSHEREVFDMVKQQMQEMHEESRRLVYQLNQKIAVRNTNEEVWFLNNELDYFKNQAFKLFQTNKTFRLEINLLKKTIKEYQLELENKNHILLKIKRKSVKHRIGKIDMAPPKLSTNEAIAKKMKINSHFLQKKRLLTQVSSVMKTQIQRLEQSDQQSRVNIRVSNRSEVKPANLHTFDEYDKSVKNMVPNFSGQSFNSNDLHILIRQPATRQCIDKQIQTEDLPSSNYTREHQQYRDDVNTTNHLDLLKSGFKLNLTYRKTKKVELQLRGSVDYQKKGINYVRSMNSSFLNNKIGDNFVIRNQKQSTILKKQNRSNRNFQQI